MQYILKNLYKVYPNHDIKDLFKWTASKKKPYQFKKDILSIRQQYPNKRSGYYEK
jgi:hypothetical protein